MKSMVLWVFGYGSLLWKAGFDYDERLVGYIKGYRRVFYQANTDHRGTAAYPGRVVTLEAIEGAITYLDLREQEYDQKEHVNFYTADCLETPTVCNVLVYIGSSDKFKNRFWAGPAPLDEMAKQIARAVGPSGPNYEYLFRLEECLHELDCVDADICELAEAVRKQMNSSKGVNVTSERPEINLTTEVYSCLENNHMIPATEHR